MKKTGLILLCLVPLYVSAQRHIKGIKGVDALIGKTIQGYYGEIGYNHYLSSKWYFNITAQLEKAKLVDNFKITSYSLNPSINYTILNPTKWWFLSLKGGGSIYLDKATSEIPESKLINYKSSYLNYGLFLGAESEIYINDRVSWLFNFRHNYNFQRNGGWFITYFGTGLRFNIY